MANGRDITSLSTGFLMRYRSGDVENHDDEVAESRWVAIDDALKMLVFKNERAVVEKAAEMIKNLD